MDILNAAYSGNVDVIEALLDKDQGAAARRYRGIILLHIAALSNSRDALPTMRALVERGAALDARAARAAPPFVAGDTPLIAACRVADLANITLLLEAGADAGLANQRGQTALIVACARRRWAVAAALLAARKAEALALSAVDTDGKNALDYALEDPSGAATAAAL